jgi:transposase-like protein
MLEFQCPMCFTYNIVRNGKTRHDKQRYKCKECEYQFSANPENKIIPLADKEHIKKLLLERLPLRGICRVMNVSLRWLLQYIETLFQQVPEHLNIILHDIDFDAYVDDKLDAMIYDLLEKKGLC